MSVTCRPGVMPATKTYLVRRLDSVEQEVTLLKKATGQECLERVCKSVGCLEREYFGLRYVKNGEHLWINLRNPLHEQVIAGHRPMLEMRVKYFVKPQKILQPITRLYFYKHMKKDLILGRLKAIHSSKAVRLAALIAQIDRGDYRNGLQYYQKIVCAAEGDHLDARIRREHQKLLGVSVEVAMEQFLTEAATLEMYGVEKFPVEDGEKVSKIVGVGPESIQMYSTSLEPLKRYTYSGVQYTAFHGKKFTAMMASHDHDTETTEQLELELRSKTAAQALYRAITEFHTFFRRDKVSRMVRNAGYCKSLIGNIKGQNPDRFYFDVTRTHREVVDHVWAILNPRNSEESQRSSHTGRGSHSREHSSASDETPPPLPPPARGMRRSLSGHARMGSGRAYPPHSRMPPLPPYSSRSLSSDGLPVGPSHGGGRPRHSSITSRALPPIPSSTRERRLASSLSSARTPFYSSSISENGSESDDSVYAGGSDTYVIMSEPSMTYIRSTESDPGVTRSMSETYVTSGDSECSGASFDNRRINSPPPDYCEVDPEHSAPLSFTDSLPDSGRLTLVSPVNTASGSADEETSTVNFDTSCVLSRTRELEGELQRLRSAMTCRLCKQSPIGATFCPCGHTVCCYSCAQRLRTCWECDEVVHSVQKMILAQ